MENFHIIVLGTHTGITSTVKVEGTNEFVRVLNQYLGNKKYKVLATNIVTV